MRAINKIYLPHFEETLKNVMRQAQHLRYSLEQIGPADQWALDNEETLVGLDALSARFARLQDLLAAPFRALAYLEMQEKKAERFPDLLAFMEKLGIVAAAENWETLRKARNDIAHQYYSDPEELRELYQIVVNGSSELLRAVSALETYAAQLKS